MKTKLSIFVVMVAIISYLLINTAYVKAEEGTESGLADAFLENDHKVSLLVENGIILNASEEEMSATLTRDIAVVMILKALGYTQNDADKKAEESPFDDTEGWFKGWAVIAYEEGLTNGTGEGSFSPKKRVTEREYLTFWLRALGYNSSQAYLETESLARNQGLISDAVSSREGFTKNDAALIMYNGLISNTLISGLPLINELVYEEIIDYEKAVATGIVSEDNELLFIEAIDTQQIKLFFSELPESSTRFRIRQSGADYDLLYSIDQEEKTITLMSAAPLESGSHEIVMYEDGETTKCYANILDSELSLSIVSDIIQLKDKAYIVFSLKDQYGKESQIYEKEGMVRAYNQDIREYMPASFVDLGSSRYILVEGLESSGSRPRDRILVEFYYHGESISKVLEVTDEVDIASLILHEPLSSSGFGRAGTDEMGIIVPYEAYTYDGAAVVFDVHGAGSDGDDNRETINGLTFTTGNKGIINPDDFIVNDAGTLLIKTGAIEGVVTLKVSKVNSQLLDKEFFIYEEPNLTAIDVIHDGRVFVKDESVELQVYAFDQYGALMSFEYLQSVKLSSSDESIVSPLAIKLTSDTIEFTPKSSGAATVDIKNGDVLLGSLSIDVQPEPYPDKLKIANLPRYFESSELASYKIELADFQVIDQYGREMDMTHMSLDISTTSPEANLNIGDGKIDKSGLLISANGVLGSNTYRVSVNGNPEIDADYEVVTIADSDIAYYEIEKIPEMKIGQTTDVYVYGMTSAHNQVIVSGERIAFITNGDSTVATVNRNHNLFTISAKAYGKTYIQLWDGADVIEKVLIEVVR